MDECSFNSQIGAYRDGELDAVQATALERHLPGCDACRMELAEMEAMSGMFAASPEPHLSQMSLYRLHRAMDWVIEEPLIRVARVVSALAACVLVASAILLARMDTVSPASSGPVAAGISADNQPLPWIPVALADESVSTPAATWYLADAARPHDDAP